MLPFLSDSFGVKTTNTSIHPRSSRKPYPIPDKKWANSTPVQDRNGAKLKPLLGQHMSLWLLQGGTPGLIGVD